MINEFTAIIIEQDEHWFVAYSLRNPSNNGLWAWRGSASIAKNDTEIVSD